MRRHLDYRTEELQRHRNSIVRQQEIVSGYSAIVATRPDLLEHIAYHRRMIEQAKQVVREAEANPRANIDAIVAKAQRDQIAILRKAK